MIEHREFYVGGAWVGAADGRDFSLIDPATEDACGVISLGSVADADAAVAAARAAFPAWAARPSAERRALIARILEIYEARAEDLAQAISLEMGAPIDWARRAQVPAGANNIRALLAALDDFAFDHPLGPRVPGLQILHDPVGVCALITPWNWPLNQVTHKVAPALAAGCTMVLKPSEYAALSARVFTEILDAAGTPPGVFNMVYGDGAGVGRHLSNHSGIDMVSFTGSTRAGREIGRAAADSFKRIALELGGKGANLVFADAPDGSVKSGARQVFNNSGQSCDAPTRMLVERSIYDEAVEIAALTAETTLVGPSSQSGRHVGPVVNRAQYDKVQSLIEAGLAEGARLVAGGPGRPDGLNRGFYVRPTVFADVTNTMTIAREEIFGPVLSILPFDSEDEAIAIANDTAYGLTNYIQSADPARIERIARQLRSGGVEVNGKGTGPGAPFGGMKASGIGREGGLHGLMEFLETKAVSNWPQA
ncbi:MAG: aldehyde dehydrogenase family protein [Rhodobacteraceae bacterium]|nr:aldehyde dehydrogenase family protein [Paracoccaceae bacterium]